MSKSYGLIIPGKEKNNEPPVSKPTIFKQSVFGSESSDEDPDDGSRPKIRGKLQTGIIGPSVMEKRQAKCIQEKALAEDPTIFQYDELYDEIETKRDELKKMKSTEARKPKYIVKLLQQAEKRKLENERRIERQVQKEREAEGEQFKDKESFVTSAYKKKLEEMRKAEEAEKREEYLESIGDVRKQGNLDGFYRHLYEQKLGSNEKIRIKTQNDKDNKTSSQLSDEENFPKITKNNKDVSQEVESLQITKKPPKSRTYRKRRSSEENEQEETEETISKKAHIQSNLDADSDFSIDDSSSDEENCDKKENSLNSTEISNTNRNVQIDNEIKKESVDEANKTSGTEQQIEALKIENDTNKITNENQLPVDFIEKRKSPKIKIDIWKKRTVGEVFEAALQRYYERKIARNM